MHSTLFIWVPERAQSLQNIATIKAKHTLWGGGEGGVAEKIAKQFRGANLDPILQTFLYQKLKKRHSNTTPARKPQGKMPCRSNKRIKLELPERGKS